MDETPEPVFHDIVQIHCLQKISIATLATAIERDGVQGWDRFGRFKTFKKGDAEFDRALDFLASEAEFNSEGRHEQSPFERAADGYDAPWYGWREGALPDLKAIASEYAGAPAQPKHAPINIKGENHSMRLIGALLEVIDGQALGEKHRQFESVQQLARELEGAYKGRVGTAESLVKKFSAARQNLIDKL